MSRFRWKGGLRPQKFLVLCKKKTLSENEHLQSDYASFDQFILDAFYAWTLQKTHIDLHLHCVHNRFQNDDFRALLLHSISQDYDEDVQNQNLSKPVMLRLFPNLKVISISASWAGGAGRDYKFDPLQLLSVLFKTELPMFGVAHVRGRRDETL